MTVEIKSDGSLFDEFFRLKHEIIKKYGVEPRGDIRNATAEKMLIEQAYLKGYIDGKAEAMQWIPCSERLPEDENIMYWTTHEDGSVVMHGFTKKNGFIFNWEVDDLEKRKRQGDVIAWKPISLPEPYKEEE